MLGVWLRNGREMTDKHIRGWTAARPREYTKAGTQALRTAETSDIPLEKCLRKSHKAGTQALRTAVISDVTRLDRPTS